MANSTEEDDRISPNSRVLQIMPVVWLTDDAAGKNSILVLREMKTSGYELIRTFCPRHRTSLSLVMRWPIACKAKFSRQFRANGLTLLADATTASPEDEALKSPSHPYLSGPTNLFSCSRSKPST